MTIAGSTFYFWWGAVQQLSVTYLGHNWAGSLLRDWVWIAKVVSPTTPHHRRSRAGFAAGSRKADRFLLKFLRKPSLLRHRVPHCSQGTLHFSEASPALGCTRYAGHPKKTGVGGTRRYAQRTDLPPWLRLLSGALFGNSGQTVWYSWHTHSRSKTAHQVL